jgi:fibronectin type 3 domain-containing protein
LNRTAAESVGRCFLLVVFLLILGSFALSLGATEFIVLPALTDSANNTKIDMAIEWDGTVYLSYVEGGDTLRLQQSEDYCQSWSNAYKDFGLDTAIGTELYSSNLNGTILAYVYSGGARTHSGFYNTSGQQHVLWWDDVDVNGLSVTGTEANDAPAGFRYFAAFGVKPGSTGIHSVRLYSTDTNAFMWNEIPSPFSSPRYHQAQPSIDFEAGRLHMVCESWELGGGSHEIFYSRTEIGDFNKWDPPRKLSATNDNCSNPIIVGRGNDLVVFWEEEHFSTDTDIKYVTTQDGGTSWSGVHVFADGVADEQIIDVHMDSAGYVHMLFQINGVPYYRRAYLGDWVFSTPEIIPQPVDSDWFDAQEAARERGAIVGNNDSNPLIVLRAGDGHLYPVRPKLALGAELCKSTNSINFGTTSVRKEFEVWNCGGGTLDFTIGDNREWIDVSPVSGSSRGEHEPIKVTVNRAGLEANHYSGTVTITAHYPGAIKVYHYVTIELDVGCSPCDSPLGLSAADGADTNMVRITWNAVPGTDHYEVYRASSEYGEFHRIKEPVTSSYDNYDVTPGQTYWYKVKACNSCGCSSFSNVDSGYAQVHKVSTPSIPVGSANGEVDQELSFSTSGAACSLGSLGHAVQYSFDWGDGTRSDWATSVTASHAYSTKGSYNVRVQARCSVDTSILSEWSYAKTVKIGVLPGVPAGVDATDGIYSNKVVTTWDASNNATRYELYRATSRTGTCSKIGETGSTAYEDYDVTPGDTYWYKIKACNVIGCSDFSSADSGHASEHVLSFVTDVETIRVLEGGTATFQVKLSTEPAETIEATVGRVSGDTDLKVTDGAELTFTPDDWNIYQTVTLMAAEDEDTVNGTAVIQIHRTSGDAVDDKDLQAVEDDRFPTYNAQEWASFNAGWNMISVALDPDDRDPAVVFDEVPGDLKLQYWNSETSTWQTTMNGTLTEVNPFQGYWLWLTEDTSVAVEGTVLAGTQRLQLGPAGGQMIGVPFEVAWGIGSGGSITVERAEQGEVVEAKSLVSAVTDGWIYDTIWSWSNRYEDWVLSTVTSGATLDPWSGYWIHTFVDNLVLRFSSAPWLGNTSASSSERNVSPPPSPETLFSWADVLRVVAKPNPVVDVDTAIFSVSGVCLCHVDGLKIEVYDLSGSLVWEEETTDFSITWHTQDMDKQYLYNAMYLYKAQVKIDGQWVSMPIGSLVVIR